MSTKTAFETERRTIATLGALSLLLTLLLTSLPLLVAPLLG